MVEELHRLIDRNAPQEVINERMVGLFERQKTDLAKLELLINTIVSDHEKRLRFLERSVAWGLGAIACLSLLWEALRVIIK